MMKLAAAVFCSITIFFLHTIFLSINQSTINLLGSDDRLLKTVNEESGLELHPFRTKNYRLKKPSLQVYNRFLRNAGLDHKESDSRKCPVTGYVSVNDRGRLGNQLLQYSTLYAFAARYRLVPVITRKMKDTLRQYFDNITLVTFDDLHPGCEFKGVFVKENEYRMSADVRERSQGNIMLALFPHDVPLFDQYKDELLSQFKFKRTYLSKAQERLKRVSRGRYAVTFISVHVRRKDYEKHLRKQVNGTLVGGRYLRKAMQIYKRWYGNAVFIVTSDNMRWCKKTLKGENDVYLIGDNNITDPGTDMATMALCNHSIVTQGSFSFWTGYLAGGQVLMASNYSSRGPTYLVKAVVQANLSNWHLIAAFT